MIKLTSVLHNYYIRSRRLGHGRRVLALVLMGDPMFKLTLRRTVPEQLTLGTEIQSKFRTHDTLSVDVHMHVLFCLLRRWRNKDLSVVRYFLGVVDDCWRYCWGDPDRGGGG